MSIFETMGQAQMLRDEGNRRLASALAVGARTLMRRLGRLLGKALRSAPGEHQLP